MNRMIRVVLYDCDLTEGDWREDLVTLLNCGESGLRYCTVAFSYSFFVARGSRKRRLRCDRQTSGPAEPCGFGECGVAA